MDDRIIKGLERQREALAWHLDAGDRLIGWKSAFSAPQAKEKLSIDRPLLGYLLDSGRLPSGATLSRAAFEKAVVEPELAIYLQSDIAAHAPEKEIEGAIGAIGPAFEIADLTFAPDDVEEILAHNIFQRHVILGDRHPPGSQSLLHGFSAEVRRNGGEPERIDDLQANTGSIVGILGSLADCLAEVGDKLQRGQTIITGSIIPPVFLENDATFHYRLEPVGELNVEFTA